MPGDVREIPLNKSNQSYDTGASKSSWQQPGFNLAPFDSAYAVNLKYQTDTFRLNDPCKQSCQQLCTQHGWANWKPLSTTNLNLNTIKTYLHTDKRETVPEEIGIWGVGGAEPTLTEGRCV